MDIFAEAVNANGNLYCPATLTALLELTRPFDDGRQADCLARRKGPGTSMRACSYHASPGGARLVPCA